MGEAAVTLSEMVSTVRAFLGGSAVFLSDADIVAQLALATGNASLEALAEKFGNAIARTTAGRLRERMGLPRVKQ